MSLIPSRIKDAALCSAVFASKILIIIDHIMLIIFSFRLNRKLRRTVLFSEKNFAAVMNLHPTRKVIRSIWAKALATTKENGSRCRAVNRPFKFYLINSFTTDLHTLA